MKHQAIKQALFEDKEIKEKYDELGAIYELQKELIKIRIERGLSQKDLAEIIGTKQSAISRLENGTYNPSVQLLAKIAHALGKELHISFS